jgi:hypothetical protein
MVKDFACCVCGSHVNDPEVLFQGKPVCQDLSCVDSVIRKMKRQKKNMEILSGHIPPQSPPTLPFYIGLIPLFN